MKKLLSVFFAMLLLTTNLVFAANDKDYIVPVALYNAHEKTKLSMANGAIKSEAEVEVENGKTKITLYLKPIEIGGVTENINKLFLVEDGKKIEAKKSETSSSPYNIKVEFEVKGEKPSEITLAFWVDAMDKLQGGKEGAGEQTAILKLDWSKAKEEKEDVKKDAPKKDDTKKEMPKTTKSGIVVFVGDDEVKFDAPPVSRNGRVLVPLRAIFEALDAKLTWDNKTQTVTAEKNGRVLTLTVNKTEAKVKDANGEKTIKLDVPAKLENGRIYVPLRFIGEAFGNKVGYEKTSTGAIVRIAD